MGNKITIGLTWALADVIVEFKQSRRSSYSGTMGLRGFDSNISIKLGNWENCSINSV